MQIGNGLLSLGVAPGVPLINIRPLDALFYAQGLVRVVGKVRMSILTHFRVGMSRTTLSFLSFSH